MAADNNDSGIEKKTQMGLPFTKKKKMRIFDSTLEIC
jgi:hypothetical protein